MKQLERPTSWDVDEDFVLPPLDALVPGTSAHSADPDTTDTTDTVDIVNEFYDTADRDLEAFGVQLVRRSGDDDTGWRVTVRLGDDRQALQWPITDSVPDEATAVLTGVRLGEPLEKVATVHTVRRRYRVRDAEFADDYVRAWSEEKLLAWREVEVSAGAPKQLVRALRKAGARVPRRDSKLHHLLPPPYRAQPSSKAVRALAGYVGEQVDAIVAGDIGLRRGRDPIHDTRVATRRLRSTLRVFATLLDQSAVGNLDDELKWFAALLGDVRDSQVQQRRFAEALDDVPDDLILGPVRARVQNDLQGVEFPARAAVREQMDSERYLALMRTLRTWRVAPLVNSNTSTGQLLRSARKAQRKADTRLRAGLLGDDDAMLHRGRKAAKRARYAAELCRAVGGSNRTVKHYKRFQSVLGDFQDTVVAREALRRMGAAGAGDGENGFTFGLLYAREQRIADECRRAAQALL